MSLTLSFITGSSTVIVEAFENDDYDLFYDSIEKEADFSLHIQPRDLQILSLCASEFNGKKPLNLKKQMTVLLDEEEKGLFSIDNKWVDYISAIPLDKNKELCNKWFEEMNKKYPKEQIDLTEEAIETIEDLISLCRFCIDNKKELFHYWEL